LIKNKKEASSNVYYLMTLLNYAVHGTLPHSF